MNVTPVIVRELRAEARNPVNYWIRVIASALLLIPVALLAFLGDLATKTDGREVFALLTGILFVAAWIIIPITISDCISRERREGTLGLLFLTPLNAREILLGKSAVNVARSLTVFAAALPILSIPILMGGIGAGDILRASFLNGAALVSAIAASLIASSVSKQRNRALILSLCLSLLFFVVCFLVPTAYLLSLPLDFLLLLRAIFGEMVQVGPGRGLLVAQQLPGLILILSLFTLFLAILSCSARLQRNWQDNPMSARQQKVYNLFCSPRFLLRHFAKWKQRKLTRNPVGWLQNYSWSARLSTWGWCGVIIIVETMIVLAEQFRLLTTFQTVLQNAFFIGIAFSAVNSFQRERQMGALELILVTPIREKALMAGRVRGIWEQFLPAFLVLLLSTWVLQDISWGYSYRHREHGDFTWFWRFWQFFSIPVVGLFFGLRCRSMLVAWFLTCGCCLAMPALLRLATAFLFFLHGGTELTNWIVLVSGLFLFGFPCYAWMRTETLLRNRSFVLNSH